MKVNRSLLQKLKEKNINLDIDKYSKQLKTQSNVPTQVSSSEVDSMDSSFMMQSINFTPAAATLNSNFRVRPISAKREENNDVMGQSQMGFSMTQSSFNRKDSKKTLQNNSKQYQHLIDQRLNQQSSQSNRTSVSSSQKANIPENTNKNTITTQNGNSLMMKTMTQSFYKDSSNSAVKKDNGLSSIQKSKPPLPSNNESNLLRQSSIKDRKGSVDVMTVSIYKDSEQNKIREQLLNYSGSEEQFSDFIQDEDNYQTSENSSSQILRHSSSQRRNSKQIGDENNEDTDSGINSFNNTQRGRSKDSKEDKLIKKAQSMGGSNNLSRNNSEEKSASNQEFDDFLEKYDRMNHGEDDSLDNSFDEELMNQVQQEFISENITAELIEKITEVKQEEFNRIRRITIRHDCEQDSLQTLGEMCPNLMELNMNDSIANCLRDLGTSMRNLKILWISRVRLQDLSGINAFPLLVELYVSYNQIKSVNDLYFNENIEVLDLEGNEIADNDQIEVLETMSKIKILTLSQNPISKKDDYRSLIRQKIPQLQLLDDIPIEQNAPEKSNSKSVLRRRGFPTAQTGNLQNNMEEEEDLYESLKKLNWNGEKFLSEDVVKQLDQELKQELTEEELLIYSVKKTITKANKKLSVEENNESKAMKSSNIFGQTLSNFNSTQSNFRRPQTAATNARNTAYSASNQQNPFAAKQPLPDSISSLVEGTDQAFYGNPLKALKHKRKNEFVTTKKNETNDPEDYTQMAIPKNIVNLLDQFKQETNDEGMNKLKEELKFFDFMVEQQINIQKKKSAGDVFNQNQNEVEQQKSKIIFKRPQIKLRTTSSQAPPSVPTKNLQSDQQFNIQQQFKDLQSKSRQPVKPTLMQNKLIENSSK